MEERMMERWRAYRNGDLVLSRATLSNGVLKETVKWFIDGKAVGQKQLFGRTANSPDDGVDHVMNHVQRSEEIHGLTGKALRQFAYDAAQTNNMLHRFSHEDKIAGDNFYCGLIVRYPEISLRQPKLLLW
jgi:hypothetical protein